MVLQICTLRDLGFVSFEVAGIWVFLVLGISELSGFRVQGL